MSLQNSIWQSNMEHTQFWLVYRSPLLAGEKSEGGALDLDAAVDAWDGIRTHLSRTQCMPRPQCRRRNAHDRTQQVCSLSHPDPYLIYLRSTMLSTGLSCFFQQLQLSNPQDEQVKDIDKCCLDGILRDIRGVLPLYKYSYLVSLTC